MQRRKLQQKKRLLKRKQRLKLKKARKEAEEKANDEKAVLTKASEIIISVGDKAGEYLGDKYKVLSREIADNIKKLSGQNDS